MTPGLYVKMMLYTGGFGCKSKHSWSCCITCIFPVIVSFFLFFLSELTVTISKLKNTIRALNQHVMWSLTSHLGALLAAEI